MECCYRRSSACTGERTFFFIVCRFHEMSFSKFKQKKIPEKHLRGEVVLIAAESFHQPESHAIKGILSANRELFDTLSQLFDGCVTLVLEANTRWEQNADNCNQIRDPVNFYGLKTGVKHPIVGDQKENIIVEPLRIQRLCESWMCSFWGEMINCLISTCSFPAWMQSSLLPGNGGQCICEKRENRVRKKKD